MMKKRRTIERKIMISFLIVVLIPCLAVGVSAYWTGYKTYKDERFNEAENRLNNVVTYIKLVEQHYLQGELAEEDAKSLAKKWVLQSDSAILIEDPHVYEKTHESIAPWWVSFLDKQNGKYKRNEETNEMKEQWVVIYHIKKWDWVIVIPFSFSYLSQPLIDIQKNTLLVMILAAIIAVELTIILSHQLSRPLKNLAAFCQQLGKGDVRVKTETEFPLSRKDEIGVLAHAIQEMLDNLEEKKQLEKKMERIERLASMGQMASGIAHEIRNPLAGIKTTTQVISSRLKLDERNLALFQGITSEIDRVDRIITNLMNLSRPREPNARLISAYDVVDQILILLEKENKDKPITFQNRISKEATFYIDLDHFKQIIINLTLNAINAMDVGGTVDFSSCNEGGIFIRDEGRGISIEDIKKIYDPFYTTSSSGSGLGLTMVHQLVLQNKGEIEIHSEEGMGTIFRLYFPTKEGE